jgi:hypothetical protein
MILGARNRSLGTVKRSVISRDPYIGHRSRVSESFIAAD